jgi:hypothetical protein
VLVHADAVIEQGRIYRKSGSGPDRQRLATISRYASCVVLFPNSRVVRFYSRPNRAALPYMAALRQELPIRIPAEREKNQILTAFFWRGPEN